MARKKKTSAASDDKKMANKTKRPTKRGAGGLFIPGTGGGPGRPKGSRGRVQLLIEGMLEDKAEQLTQALIKRALRGYSVPLQLCFDRLAPARKESTIQLALPPINSLKDLLVAQRTVISAAAEGDITPSEASAVAGLLELRRRTIETIEIESRLAAIEAKIAAQPGGALRP